MDFHRELTSRRIELAGSRRLVGSNLSHAQAKRPVGVLSEDNRPLLRPAVHVSNKERLRTGVPAVSHGFRHACLGSVESVGSDPPPAFYAQYHSKRNLPASVARVDGFLSSHGNFLSVWHRARISLSDIRSTGRLEWLRSVQFL